MLHRGWGPKALNMNVLLHPEIISSKPSVGNEPAKGGSALSNVPAEALNLSEGLAGSLIDLIVFEKNKENRSTSIMEVRGKRQATAKQRLENHEKRCTAGLITSAGRFVLDNEILGYVRHTKELEEAKKREKEAKAKDIYDALLAKVEAIRAKNLPPEKWTNSELNTMIQWFKRPNDTAMPTKKAEKLARYYDICGRGDPPVPVLQDLPPLPLPAPIDSAAANESVPAIDDHQNFASIDDTRGMEYPLVPVLEALPPPLPAPRDSVAADGSVPDLDDGCRSCASNDAAVEAALAMVLPWGV